MADNGEEQEYTVGKEVTNRPGGPVSITIHNNPTPNGTGNRNTSLDATVGVPCIGSITVRNILKGTSVVILFILILLVVLAVAIFFIVREASK